jgi:hypothetical protein
MGKKVSSNTRIGGFAGMNSGSISGSVSDVKLNAKQNSSGFVYDNSGDIASAVSLNQPKADKSNAGFCHRNRGNMASVAWVRPFTKSELKEIEKIEKAKAEAEQNGVEYDSSKEKQKPKHSDEQFRFTEEKSTQELLDEFGFSSRWRFGEGEEKSLMPDISHNKSPLFLGEQVVEISTAEELAEIIEAINSGDPEAANGSYRLTSNINMKGKTIERIGIDESVPFTGKFDGDGNTIKNFRISAKGKQYAGFFGYVKDAEVANLEIDCIVAGKGGNIVGGMVGVNEGGSFTNCQVKASLTIAACTGGFAGKNAGSIVNCCIVGAMTTPFPILPVAIASAVAILLIAIIALLLALSRMNKPVYTPSEKIDVNQIPADDGIVVDPPPPGSNRISFNVLREISISYETKVGRMDYINPKRATQDVVISLTITDAELTAKGIDLVAAGVRSIEEQNAEGYDPAKAYTVLYHSDRLQIGYKLEACKISALPGGEHLPVGDYEMVIIIDAYDPETFEKAAVNAQAPVTVHIVG